MFYLVSRALSKLNLANGCVYCMGTICFKVKDNYKIARLYIEAFQMFFYVIYMVINGWFKIVIDWWWCRIV